jgi:hypothetical protein
MATSLPIRIDGAAGEAWFGARCFAIATVGTHGELQLGGADGPTLRPITFGERRQIVARARVAAQPRAYLCAGILHAATVKPGLAEHDEQVVLALTLAGGDEAEVPFMQAAAVVTRATGWEDARLAATEALEVDRWARQLVDSPASEGWIRYVLTADLGDDLGSFVAELADNMLNRGADDAELLSNSAPVVTEATQPIHSESSAPLRGAILTASFATNVLPQQAPTPFSATESLKLLHENEQPRHAESLLDDALLQKPIAVVANRAGLDSAQFRRSSLRETTSDTPRPRFMLRDVVHNRPISSVVPQRLLDDQRGKTADSVSPVASLPEHDVSIHSFAHPTLPEQTAAEMSCATKTITPQTQTIVSSRSKPVLPDLFRQSLHGQRNESTNSDQSFSRFSLSLENAAISAVALADAVASLLHEEADLRGIE